MFEQEVIESLVENIFTCWIKWLSISFLSTISSKFSSFSTSMIGISSGYLAVYVNTSWHARPSPSSNPSDFIGILNLWKGSVSKTTKRNVQIRIVLRGIIKKCYNLKLTLHIAIIYGIKSLYFTLLLVFVIHSNFCVYNALIYTTFAQILQNSASLQCCCVKCRLSGQLSSFDFDIESSTEY